MFFAFFQGTDFTVVNSVCTVYTYIVHVIKNIKNGFHDTIYTFKNYFTTVFSVFSNNKLNPNGSLFRAPHLCDCGNFFFGFTTNVLCCLSLTTYNLSSCEMFCENYCYYGVIDP